MFKNILLYRTELFKDSDFFKNLYKIQFWSYENSMPIFEEISIHRIKEKYVKNLESKKILWKIKKKILWLKNNLFSELFKDKCRFPLSISILTKK